VRHGIKISQAPYDSENQIISLPLYSLESFIRTNMLLDDATNI